MKITDSKTITQSGINVHRSLFAIAKAVFGYLPGTALFSLCLAVLVLIQMFLLSMAINTAFMQSERVSHAFLLFLLAVIFFRGLLLWFRERFAQRNAAIIKSDLRRQAFKKYLKLGVLYSRNTATGESVALLTEGVEKLDDYFTKYIPAIIHILILPSVIILFTLYVDWISGLVMLITAPLILFFMWLIGSYAKQLTRNQWGKLSILSSQFLDAIQGLKSLKIFGANKRESDRVEDASEGFRFITMKVLKVAFLSGMVLELAASISIALVAVQVGIRLIEGLMDYQTGLFILLLVPEFYLPFRMLGAYHHSGMEGAAAAEKLFAIPDEAFPIQVKSHRHIAQSEKPGIVCEAVYFSYPGSEQFALNGIHCSLEPGKITAVVGHTGSGKTTLAFLIMGFLQASAGRILVNDIPLDQFDAEMWRKNLSYVPQHPHFFNATILENLMMANPKANDNQVVYACEQAGAHAFISRLPNGYHTRLTESASRLSGGQKQQLAIARAFLKNTPLLILDEPSSNLDPESEQGIAEATNRLAQEKTTLIIAHRLQTVRKADTILVLDNGVIIESGNHNSLMEKRGVYFGYLETLGLTNGGRL